MKKRIYSGLCALLVLCSSLTCGGIAASEGYDVSVTVDVNGGGTPISPYIFVSTTAVIWTKRHLPQFVRAVIVTQAITGKITAPMPVLTGSMSPTMM